MSKSAYHVHTYEANHSVFAEWLRIGKRFSIDNRLKFKEFINFKSHYKYNKFYNIHTINLNFKKLDMISNVYKIDQIVLDSMKLSLMYQHYNINDYKNNSLFDTCEHLKKLFGKSSKIACEFIINNELNKLSLDVMFYDIYNDIKMTYYTLHTYEYLEYVKHLAYDNIECIKNNNYIEERLTKLHYLESSDSVFATQYMELLFGEIVKYNIRKEIEILSKLNNITIKDWIESDYK